jgi:hypothetical protein
MSLDVGKLQSQLASAVSAAVRLDPLGRNTFRLITPFAFEDGDSLVAFMEVTDGHARFTDHGHTLMHVSYDVDITREARTKILDRVLATHQLKFNEGEISAECEITDVAVAFWDFIQGLLRTSDIAQWKVERAASLFFQEFELFMEQRIRPHVPLVAKDWHDNRVDESGLYAIPWTCMNGGEPLFVFPILTTGQCDQAVISCLKYETASYKFKSFAAFEDIDKINNRPRNQLLDIGTKSVTSFDAQRRDRAERLILDHFAH